MPETRNQRLAFELDKDMNPILRIGLSTVIGAGLGYGYHLLMASIKSG